MNGQQPRGQVRFQRRELDDLNPEIASRDGRKRDAPAVL
jgi:hypothetical protein